MDTPGLDDLLADLGADDRTVILEPATDPSGVAVIGIAGRVGAADSPAAFWAAVSGGADLIGALPETRRADADALKSAAVGAPLGDALPYGYLDHVDRFDPERFAVSPVEASLMDPHQRLFLTTAVDALEDAGYGGDALRGTRTGVYVGSGASSGMYLAGYTPRDPAAAGMAMSGTVNSVIAGRVSHLLDLRGPAIVVDTACSSSLAAVITACRDLREGVVDTAVAGGVRLTLVPPEKTDHRFGIEAPTGRTRTFSCDAEGTGGGEGVVSLVLKPLRTALTDGDHVYGVLRGWAMNQDGASAGVTAPNAAAQSDVLRAAWRDADVDPASIGYIEAHGTATALGDPVEVTGLTDAFAAYTDRRQFCAIGSAKTNVGHLDAAAGITGLLKVLLMLRHRRIPPSLHFASPNPEIDFAESPVYLSDRLHDWDGPAPLRAGVSSFGISGTNCHVVVEEAPVAAARLAPPRADVLALSGRTAAELDAAVGELRDHLAAHPGLALADVCLTLGTGRPAFEHRACFVAGSRDELLDRLAAYESGTRDPDVIRGSARVVANVNGLGEGYLDADAHERLSKQASESCEALARDAHGPDAARRTELRALARLFASGAKVPWARLFEGGDARRVPLPAYRGTPRRIWRPAAAPATVATARLHPLVHRHVVEGRGLDVFESDLSAGTCFELGEHVINGRHVLVGTGVVEMAYVIARRVLGATPVLTNLHYRDPLVTEGAETRRLQCVATRDGDSVTLEFRSRVEGAGEWTEHCRVDAAPLSAEDGPAGTVDLAELRGRYRPVTESVSYHREMVRTEGRLWHSSREVFFGEDGEALLRFEADAATAEVKAAYALFPPILDSGVNLGLLREDEPYLPLAFERAAFTRDLPDAGYCWIRPADPSAWNQSDIRTYHVTVTDLDGAVVGTVSRYSVSRVPDPRAFLTGAAAAPSLHEIGWNPIAGTSVAPPAGAEVMVLTGAGETGHPLAARLGSRGATVVRLTADEEEARAWADRVVDTGTRRIVHLVPSGAGDEMDAEALRPVFTLVRALAARSLPEPVEYALVTTGGQAVLAGDPSDPAARAVASAALCLDAEYANIAIRVVDTDLASPAEVVADAVLGERRRSIVAVRRGGLYEPALVPIADGDHGPAPFDDADGAVVITGGLGGMGLALADHLTAANPRLRVALLNRRLDDRDPADVPAATEALARLGDRRDRVRLWRADVTDGPALTACLDGVRAADGPIVGVVHAAGLPGDGFAVNKSWEEFARVLAPKTVGTRLLDRATRTDPLAFFVLCSSMTAVFGAPGQSDYAAANGYLDGYAARMRARGRPASAIDWTGWSGSGMARRHGVTGAGYFAAFVDDAEGCELFRRAVAAPSAQVVAGEFLPGEVARQREALERVVDVAAIAVAPTTGAVPSAEAAGDAVDFEDLSVRGRPAGSLDATERAVAVAWCATLGTTEVDVYSPFFESGGNSLLASRLQLELDRSFPGVVNIADIFIHPTVTQLSGYVTGRTAPRPAPERRPPAKAPAPVPTPTGASLSALLDEFLAGRIGIDEVIEP